MSFSSIALSSIRFARNSWPFALGKDVPNHIGAFAAKLGFLKPAWYEFRPGLWMEVNVRDLIQETILLEGIWDPHLTELIDSELHSGDVFIDVGAHAGYFSLIAASRVGLEGTVLAIEPNPIMASQVVKNVARSNLANVQIEQVACSGEANVVRLYLHNDSNSSKASLSNVNARGGGYIDVPCLTLDSLVDKHSLPAVSLVKIDVEGAELMVLKGMKKILRELRPVVVLELEAHLLEAFGTSVNEVREFVSAENYRVESLGGHANFICRPAA